MANQRTSPIARAVLRAFDRSWIRSSGPCYAADLLCEPPFRPQGTFFEQLMRLSLRSAPVSVLLLAALCLQVASAATLEDIERGLPEQVAASFEEARGYKVVKSELAGGYFVNQPQTNETVGVLRVCKGRIYSHSTKAVGGAVGFVKRVEQFNKQFGTPEVSASSAMLEAGEINTIEASWKRGRHVVTLTFTPASQGIGETQWVQYAVPAICQR